MKPPRPRAMPKRAIPHTETARKLFSMHKGFAFRIERIKEYANKTKDPILLERAGKLEKSFDIEFRLLTSGKAVDERRMGALNVKAQMLANRLQGKAGIGPNWHR